MKKIILTIIVFAFIVFMPIKTFAYSPDAVSDSQLQEALQAMKNKIDNTPNYVTALAGYNRYFTVFYSGEKYYIYMTTERGTFYPSSSPENFQIYPCLWTDKSPSSYGMDMVINSDGSYNANSLGLNNSHFPMLYFFLTPAKCFVKYCSYDVLSYTGAPIHSAVAWGTTWTPDSSTGGPLDSQYSKDVPTPAGTKTKFILPKGLFPKIRETQIELTWNSTSGLLHTEIYLMYDYKNGDDRITKLLPYVTYSDSLFASIGKHTAKMQTDIEAFIHSKNPATAGQTFENGKLNLTHYYVRYSTLDGDKLKYGNWVKIDLVTGKSSFDDGNVVSQYNEVYTDKDGNEVEVTDSEYNGIMLDNNGKKVEPTSLRSFTDYLMAIPNILSNTFSSLTSLTSSVGKFGALLTSLFVFLPPVATAIIVAGIGLLVVLGIVKFLK